MVMIIAGTAFSQLRLGIQAENTYNGVMISGIFSGYPAASFLRVGDIVRYAQVVYNSQPVVMGNDLVVMSMSQKVIVNLSNTNSYGQYINSSTQLQSIILSAPYNSTVVLTLLRNGYSVTYAIGLLNNSSNPVIMMAR
jgi:S1-C subfamily serine protease